MPQNTVKCGVIGWPVKHSLSPFIHEFWRNQLSVEGIYNRIYCPPSKIEFQNCVRTLVKNNYRGVNVTLPHKFNAFEIADEKTEIANKLGCANTLTFSDGKILADNTDCYGFVEMVRPSLTGVQKNVALVLGAGGAAPAVCLALYQLGFQKIIISNRSENKAKELVSRLEFVSNYCKWEDTDDLVSECDMIVNTTSLGMAGFDEVQIDLSQTKKLLVIADIIYTPQETGLLKKAKKLGLKTVGGLDMLIHQALPGFQNWVGSKPEIIASLADKLNDHLNRTQQRPVKIGLTGSIGMGKSTVAKMLEELGASIWNADQAVHRLYAQNGPAVAPIEEIFPEAIVAGEVDRKKLSAQLIDNPEGFRQLEQIVHPLVAKDREDFINEARMNKTEAVVLDIPLLFETGQAHHFDEVIVVSTDEEIRRERVLAREGMTKEKLNSILTRQTSEAERAFLAEHIIRTDVEMAETRRQVSSVYKEILENYFIKEQ